MSRWTNECSWSVRAPADRVFRALTTQTDLEAWFAEGVQVEVRVGGAYRFWGRHTVGMPDEASATGTITEMEPGRLLAFEWTLHGVPGIVRVSLSSEGDDEAPTKVTIAHTLDGMPDVPRPRELVDDWWRLVLGNLGCHVTGKGQLLRPDFHDPHPEVRLSLRVDAPPEVVFRALIEPAALREWMGAPDPVVEPRVGGRYHLGWPAPEGSRAEAHPDMEILEIVPDQLLVMTWPDWRGDPAVPPQRVSWILEPQGSGTLVTLVHSGFVRPVDLSDYPFGWAHFLGALARVAERLAA